MGNECCGARTENKPAEKEKLYVRLTKPEEVKKIKEHIAEQFNAADKNHNGSLNFEELYAITCKAHENSGLPKPEKEAVRKTLDLADKNKDKSLKLDEYTTMIMKHLEVVAAAEKKADEEAAAAKKKADDEAAAAKKKADDDAAKNQKPAEDPKKKSGVN